MFEALGSEEVVGFHCFGQDLFWVGRLQKESFIVRSRRLGGV